MGFVDLPEFRLFSLLEHVEPFIFDDLTHQFICDLITPFVLFRHAEVVNEKQLVEVIFLGVQ